MGEQDDETYFAEVEACKLDFLEWTPEKGVKVSDTSRQFAREFLDSSVTEGHSNTGCSGAQKTFNKIASMLMKSKTENDGTFSKATIDEIAELSGTNDRRIYTVLEALESEGWKPSQSCEGEN